MSALLPEGANRRVSGIDVSIELEAVPADETLAGAPHQGVAELGAIGGTEVGIWELRDGTVTDTEVDELFVVLSGGASIEFLDADPGSEGRVVQVGPGDVMRLVAGSRTKWTVADHIRKVYISAE